MNNYIDPATRDTTTVYRLRLNDSGEETVGVRVDPGTALPWVTFCERAGDNWQRDDNVTILAKLVPEPSPAEYLRIAADILADRDGVPVTRINLHASADRIDHENEAAERKAKRDALIEGAEKATFDSNDVVAAVVDFMLAQQEAEQ